MVKKIVSNKSKHNKQGLQKFTDFSSIKTVEDILLFNIEQPKDLKDLYTYLRENFSEAVNKCKGITQATELFLKVSELIHGKDKNEFLKADSWRINESLIQSKTHNHILENRLPPSTTQLSNTTGLSRVTILKHQKERGGQQLKSEVLNSLESLTPLILTKLYEIGMKDSNVKALNSYLNYFTCRIEAKGSPVVNNSYIQINNLAVDEQTINKLPEATLLQIEELISKGLKQIV